MLRENSLANLNRAVPRQANVAALVSSVSSVVYFVSYLLSNIMLAITQIFVIALNFINVTLMWLVWYDCRVRWTPVILKYLYHGVLYYFTILYCKAQKVVPLSQLYSCNICLYYLFSTRFRFWYGSITFFAILIITFLAHIFHICRLDFSNSYLFEALEYQNKVNEWVQVCNVVVPITYEQCTYIDEEVLFQKIVSCFPLKSCYMNRALG